MNDIRPTGTALQALSRTVAFIRLAWRMVSERATRFPMHPRLRPMLLRALGARVGHGVRIEEVMFINLFTGGFKNLSLGDHAYVGAGTVIDLTGRVNIGSHVSVSPCCTVLTHSDPRSPVLTSTYPRIVETVTILDHVWIGAGATVLAGVTVGTKTVIGAASLVNRDIGPNTTAFGVPARPRADPNR